MNDSKVNEDSGLERARKNLEETLNLHGYGFQEAIKQVTIHRRTDFSEVNWGWKYFGSEIPVPINDDKSHTHVDLILRAWTKRRIRHTGYFLVGECKRVNPSKAFWCFVKRQNTWPEQADDTVQFDCLEASGSSFTATSRSAYVRDAVYDLGIEVKTDLKGDPCTSPDRSPIQAAIGQVLRGVAGFIDTLSSSIAYNDVLGIGEPEILIPVVFTTADLFASSLDLGKSEIGDGKLLKAENGLTRVPWIWFNHHRTPNLRPKTRFGYGDEKEKHVSKRYRDTVRSVVIVNGHSLEQFLTYNWNEIFLNHA